MDDGPKCSIHGFSASTQKRYCPLHNVEEIKEEDIGNSDVKKDKHEVDENWCRMCGGRNLHRKLYGEDHSCYPPAPRKPKEQGEITENTKDKEKEIKKGPGIWCPICKGFDIHRKVYEWPHREEEKEDSSSDENDDIDWCPMCKGFKVHRKLYGEDYNDYPNPPFKDPTKDKKFQRHLLPMV